MAYSHSDSPARMATCQRGVAVNRVGAGRMGGNSVCTSWLKGEASFALGEILRISETAGILQCKLRSQRERGPLLSNSRARLCWYLGVNCGYAGHVGEGNDMSRLRKTFPTCPVILCL